MRSTILSLLAAFSLAASALAQPTAFTYQGQLKNGAALASGLHDFRFKLFDAAEAGTQVGSTVCIDNVNVVNGLFTATLEFGQVFTLPASRFLEIEVRTDTGLTCVNTTGFTLLGSRQQLTAAPIANHAKAAFALDAADGAPASAVIVDNSGNVGIGTAAPTHTVHVANVLPTIALQDIDSTTQQAGYVDYRDSGNVSRGWVGFGTAGSPDFSIVNARASGKIILQTLGGGGEIYIPADNLGIGVPNPAHKLHIGGVNNAVMILQDTGSNANQSGYVGFWNASNQETGWMGYGTPGSAHMTIYNGRTSGNIVIDPGPGGVVQVPVLQITGADLAEKFPASERLEPGMVVAIDRDHEGKLCLSRSAYDRAVAGVVSGANDFAAGAILGNLPGHDDAPAVALSGRVYVWCDATAHPIEPGDLLTSSDTPGHAMKAADRDRAHGAVLGKAMTGLSSGKGMVLVLVNLQ